MTPTHSSGDPETLGRFDYFMLRVWRSDHQPDRVSGLVERLGTGEKWSFETSQELLRVVAGGHAPDANMAAASGPRNTSHEAGPSPGQTGQ